MRPGYEFNEERFRFGFAYLTVKGPTQWLRFFFVLSPFQCAFGTEPYATLY